MAIAFDAATTSSTTPFNHTCTGTNLILFVAIGNSTITAQSTTAVTYGGVAMTEIQSRQQLGNAQVKLWYLIAPATGSNSVAITGGTSSMRASAVSFTGVAQTSPIGASNVGSANMTSTGPVKLNVAVTTTQANSWLVGAFTGEGSQATTDLSFTIGTERSEAAAGTGVASTASNTTTTTGSYSIEWSRNQSPARNAVAIVAEFKEPASSVVQDIIGSGLGIPGAR